jgi:uncharacterized protein
MATFLKAEWRKLIMVNYVVNPEALLPYLPFKTELDLYDGNCYLSLVGFMFQNTCLKGCKIPFHINFEEVNLRFYVNYRNAGTCKRGVVFIKEIVPRPALTLVANMLYGEHYQTMKMSHSWLEQDDKIVVEYAWKKDKWNIMRVLAGKEPCSIGIGSEEEFITEHYWGYTRLSKTKTSEYEVAHPRWEVYPVNHYTIDVDFAATYGLDFKFLQDLKPASVLLAEGSEVKVLGKRLIC